MELRKQMAEVQQQLKQSKNELQIKLGQRAADIPDKKKRDLLHENR